MTAKTPKKVEMTIELTEHVLEKINELKGGVTISDYMAELISEFLKKQKPLPPEVID
jgi:predicted CopG family antitoxin